MDYSRELPPTELKRKQIRSTILFFASVVLFGCLLGFFFKMSPETRRTGRFQTVGDFPEDHAWFNTSVPLSLYDQLRGHVVVLLFEDFETLDDVRGLIRLKNLCNEFVNEPVQIVVIYRISTERLRGLYSQLDAWSFAYPIIIDDTGEVALNFGISGTPALLLIDSTARVSAWYYEGWEEANLESMVGDLLRQGIASRTLAQDAFHQDGGEYIPERFNSIVLNLD